MQIQALKSKIHRATVVQAELNYIGSITIYEALLEQAGIVDIDNGSRFETYAISGARESGMICLNGAAARKVAVGDKIIIMSYASMTPEELKENPPRVVFVDEKNQTTRVTRYEKHGRLEDLV